MLYNWMTAMLAERLVGKWKLPGSNGCANSNADSASRSHCAGSVRRERLSATLAGFGTLEPFVCSGWWFGTFRL